MRKYITTDGKTCREVNPFEKTFVENGVTHYNQQWLDFEANVKYHPLTKEMPIGEFYGKEVWQYQERGKKVWETANVPRDVEFNDWSNHLYDIHDAASRIAITPIEKPLEGEETPAIDAGETVETMKEAMDRLFDYGENANAERPLAVRYGYEMGFEIGANWQATHALKGYVKVDEVVKFLKELQSQSEDISSHLALHIAITQIKNLTK